MDLAEGRPVGLAEVQLGVGALPEQEVGQTQLAAGADDEIGVRLPGGIQVAGNVLNGERLGQLSQRCAGGDVFVEYGP